MKVLKPSSAASVKVRLTSPRGSVIVAPSSTLDASSSACASAVAGTDRRRQSRGVRRFIQVLSTCARQVTVKGTEVVSGFVSSVWTCKARWGAAPALWSAGRDPRGEVPPQARFGNGARTCAQPERGCGEQDGAEHAQEADGSVALVARRRGVAGGVVCGLKAVAGGTGLELRREQEGGRQRRRQGARQQHSRQHEVVNRASLAPRGAPARGHALHATFPRGEA